MVTPGYESTGAAIQRYQMMRYLSTLMFVCLVVCSAPMAQDTLHRLPVHDMASMYRFFSYRPGGGVLISGHRGSIEAGFPENSIEAFAYVLRHTPAFFEIDPRLTKDSVIVLMHDATLDRTTTGTGKLSDYTWEQVKQLRLKDAAGNITPYRVPTLSEAIEWARGKTVLNLDRKDVPLEMTARMIEQHHADAFVMVTVHDAQQAKFYHDRHPGRMMSAFVKTTEAMASYEKAGIPWKQLIAYVGPEEKPAIRPLMDSLHARGVRCMISAAPVYDKLPGAAARTEAYRNVLKGNLDILESDYPVSVAAARK